MFIVSSFDFGSVYFERNRILKKSAKAYELKFLIGQFSDLGQLYLRAPGFMACSFPCIIKIQKKTGLLLMSFHLDIIAPYV